MIKLKKDNSKNFDLETIDYFFRNREAFCVDVEDVKCLREKVLKGECIKRINSERGEKFYYIMDNDKIVGELWTYRYKEPIEELSIRIFDEYQRMGYATASIKNYIQNHRGENMSLIANCKDINHAHNGIRKMLLKCGFKYLEKENIYYENKNPLLMND